MVDYTRINVSKDGKYLFATEPGQLAYEWDAKPVYELLKENKKRCRRFGIATYCRKSIDDKEHWTHITVDVGDEKIGVDIKYPLSIDFDREFRELIYKYINNSN